MKKKKSMLQERTITGNYVSLFWNKEVNSSILGSGSIVLLKDKEVGKKKHSLQEQAGRKGACPTLMSRPAHGAEYRPRNTFCPFSISKKQQSWRVTWGSRGLFCFLGLAWAWHLVQFNKESGQSQKDMRHYRIRRRKLNFMSKYPWRKPQQKDKRFKRKPNVTIPLKKQTNKNF